jgi:hypothetical protein
MTGPENQPGLVALVPADATILDRWLLHRLSLRREPPTVLRADADTVAGGEEARRFLDEVAELLEDAALAEWTAPVAVAGTERPALATVATSGVATGAAPAGAPAPLLRVRLGSPASPFGRWSAVQVIARQEPTWLGSHVLLEPSPGAACKLAWEGTPQISPGDTAAALTARALIQAASALDALLDRIAAGETPDLHEAPASPEPAAPEAEDWQAYLERQKGATARLTWERALR